MSKNDNFTLEDLLATIEKQASDAETEGSAADKKEDAKESEKKDSGETSEAEAEKAKAKKKEGQEKSASDQGADLAKEILEKVATNNKENTEMSKQASVAGKALADAILTKLASAGDVITENGVTPGTVPQKNIVDNAEMKAQDDAKIQAVPGTDGAGNGGSVNQIFDAIVADAMGEGAAAYDQTQSTCASAGEGAAVDQGTTAQGHADESQEKMAAVITLVENGLDFDSAVDLVKEAEEALWIEEDAQIKQAAVSELVGQGFDFETAVDLIKEAGTGATVKSIATGGRNFGDGQLGAGSRKAGLKALPGKVKEDIAALAEKAKAKSGLLSSAIKSEASNLRGAVGSLGKSPRFAMQSIAGNRIAQAAAAAGAYALTREKKAAFEALVDAGVDFEKAAELVTTKSMELYGL